MTADTRSMLDQPLSRRLRAIKEADELDETLAAVAEPEPQSFAAPPRRAPLGQLLVEKGALSEADLAEALERQRTDMRPIGQILLDMGAITPHDLARALTGQRGLDSSDSLRRRLATEDGSEPGNEASAEELYLVREAGFTEPLYSADTLLDAADAAFELIEEHDPDGLEIVRARGGELEHVWSYQRGDAPGPLAESPDAA